MGNSQARTWLAAAASLIIAPGLTLGQVVPDTGNFSGEIVSGPIVMGETFPIMSGTAVGPWVGSDFSNFGPNGPAPAARASADPRDRKPGADELLWKTLHDRAWQALRSFVPNDEVRQERLDAADKLLRAALERLQPYKPDDGRVATTYNDLGWVFFLRGQYDQARSLVGWALQNRESRLGPYNPQVGDSLSLMARIAIAQDRQDEALDFAKRALQSYIRSSPGRQIDLHTPIALDLLGAIYSDRDELDIAEAYIRRAFEWRQELYDAGLYPPDKDIQVIVELARSNVTLAGLLKKLGRDQEAGVLEDQARYLLESAAGTPAAAAGGSAPAPLPGI